jgi:hypothetical protein
MSADKPCFFPFSLPKEYASIVEEARTHGIYFKEATITDDPDMQVELWKIASDMISEEVHYFKRDFRSIIREEVRNFYFPSDGN